MKLKSKQSKTHFFLKICECFCCGKNTITKQNKTVLKTFAEKSKCKNFVKSIFFDLLEIRIDWKQQFVLFTVCLFRLISFPKLKNENHPQKLFFFLTKHFSKSCGCGKKNFFSFFKCEAFSPKISKSVNFWQVKKNEKLKKTSIGQKIQKNCKMFLFCFLNKSCLNILWNFQKLFLNVLGNLK
jgi:hypothetical protein